jgi:hypothetical protein
VSDGPGAGDADTQGAGLAPCFVAGTRIATERGERPVETLALGDRMVTVDGSAWPITWIGHRRISRDEHAYPPDVMPIRVRADAFATGAPRRDLLLSPDHAVFLNGVLIPVRHLVNGATLLREKRQDVSYWHFALTHHDVVLAEGLACETLRDPGEIGASFEALTEPRAKLVEDGPALAEARTALLARATQLGYVVTTEPDIRLVVAGQVLRPALLGRVLRFELPAEASGVRLLSRSAVPAELQAAGADPRRLGVALSGMAFRGERVPLDDQRLGAGWHEPERNYGWVKWRWTDGNAAIALMGAGVLDLQVAISERYWLHDDPLAALRDHTFAG